ncbi:phage tail protein [Halopseudomonas phragmitis]|uniref:Phage tail protein n=1 Tax=Halopseudomonas phragmitis TaxID=1931241 RepID=A0A1V0B1C9_9GAMM|nr:tail fiber protein [Halopseudomonas phragmitis]AQZ93701.1 phage tail protein [Halopseudomonas phragmitis]
MSEPFLGEVKLVSFNFPPKGWALCDGQLLPINQNQALFALLGTTYGGNGMTTFALPDLRGRVPVHSGSGITQGQRAGEEAVTLNVQQMPQHLHLPMASNQPASLSGINQANSESLAISGAAIYAQPGQSVSLSSDSLMTQGGSQPHNNMQPSLVLNFCIALQGIFPSQN